MFTSTKTNTTRSGIGVTGRICSLTVNGLKGGITCQLCIHAINGTGSGMIPTSPWSRLELPQETKTQTNKMITRFKKLIASASCAFATIGVFAQGTAFTYQGRLNTDGSPANGRYDFTFTLWNTNSGGSEIGGAFTNAGVGVANGLFTVPLDFGAGIYTSQSCWLQVNVETNGVGPYVALTPRQPLTPTPYAVYAESSGGVANTSISAAQLNTPGAPSSGQVLVFNGSSLEWTNPASGSSGWSLTGNAGTSPNNGDFLGTTDDQPLKLEVNNLNGLLLSPEPNNTVSLSVGPGAVYGAGAQGVAVFGGYYGGNNQVYANYSTIAGGYNNLIDSGAPESFIAGGQGNSIELDHSAIGGGYGNTIITVYGTIPGGFSNLVSGTFGFAAGNGAQASISGAFVWADNSGGMFASTANNQFSVRAKGGVNFVTGGAGLKIDGQAVSTSGGGTSWSLTGNAGTVPGIDFLGTTDAKSLELYVNGAQALLLDTSGNVVAGGSTTVPGSQATTIGGGFYSTATSAYCSVIGGGYDNSVTANYSTVSGGQLNSASANGAYVGGGFNNTAGGSGSVVAGGTGNLAGGIDSFAAGNAAQAVNNGAFVWADDSTSAPFSSTANNQFSVRATGGVKILTGGAGMTIDGVPVSTGGGGGTGWGLTGNAGTDPSVNFLGTTDDVGLELHVDSVRGMGLYPAQQGPQGADNATDASVNVAGGFWGNYFSTGVVGATIAGGGEQHYDDVKGAENLPNAVNGNFGTVGGGYSNIAGYGGTVPGGMNNSATGNGSFAAGQQAQALHNGAFAWADSQAAPFASTGNDQFCIRAQGGMKLDNSTSVAFGSATRQMLELYRDPTSTYIYGIGVQTGTLYERAGAGGGFAWYSGGVHNNGQDNNGGGATLMMLNGSGDLNVAANASVCTLTIRGGCDVAEPFAISTPSIVKGSVVVIDDNHAGQLKLSDEPYDTRVAGIVSGANGINPGIALHQDGVFEEGQSVALSGRVYVQADAAYGSIKPGDLLTTSATPGHAMKVTDHAKAQGAILGKAMSGLKDGQGMVLVLVSLQ